MAVRPAAGSKKKKRRKEKYDCRSTTERQALLPASRLPLDLPVRVACQYGIALFRCFGRVRLDPSQNPGRIAHNDRVGRDISGYYTPGAYDGSFANGDAA